MGAWIEIVNSKEKIEHVIVAPHMDAWIEIISEGADLQQSMVAPHMGAWIEIKKVQDNLGLAPSRTPHGCVD